MGGEQSEAFYQDFLQHMRTVYRADAIKGNDNWYMGTASQWTSSLFINYPITLGLKVMCLLVAGNVQAKRTLFRVLTNQARWFA